MYKYQGIGNTSNVVKLTKHRRVWYNKDRT